MNVPCLGASCLDMPRHTQTVTVRDFDAQDCGLWGCVLFYLIKNACCMIGSQEYQFLRLVIFLAPYECSEWEVLPNGSPFH